MIIKCDQNVIKFYSQFIYYFIDFELDVGVCVFVCYYKMGWDDGIIIYPRKVMINLLYLQTFIAA